MKRKKKEMKEVNKAQHIIAYGIDLLFLIPASIKSNFVTTAKVLRPSISTSLAIFRLSDVAISVLAVTTAKIIEFGFAIYFNTRIFICCSISGGWSPIGT